MPLINAHIAAGRTAEKKTAFLEAVTAAAEEHLDAPRDSIRVWITEFPASDYMAAGELLSDKRKRLAP